MLVVRQVYGHSVTCEYWDFYQRFSVFTSWVYETTSPDAAFPQKAAVR
jgi:hypothetical protein